MEIPKDIEKLLLKSREIGKFHCWEGEIGICDVIKSWKEVDGADIGLVGIPFDTSELMRRGARSGPEGVRNALAFSNSYEPGLDVDLSTNLKIVEFGDIDVLHTNVIKTYERVEKVITAIYKLGIIPVVIGGDHGPSYATIKSLINNVKGNVGVITIDAHPDVRTIQQGEVSSGTPFRRILEEPERPVLPKNLVELGVNGWHNSRSHMEYCREMGVTVITAREIHKRGIEDVVAQALDIASNGTEAIFLSIDIDGFDIAVAPGTAGPSPGGLTSYQGLEAVWQIGQHPLSRGMDIMEVAPPFDVQDITSSLAAGLVLHYFGAVKTRLEKENV